MLAWPGALLPDAFLTFTLAGPSLALPPVTFRGLTISVVHHLAGRMLGNGLACDSMRSYRDPISDSPASPPGARPSGWKAEGAIKEEN